MTTQAFCTNCGTGIILNSHAAKYAAKGIMCQDCRNPHWTKATYSEYLKSDTWKSFRLDALRRAGRKCQVCASTERLEVHHNDYSRLGCELFTDVVVLCRRCHTVHHLLNKELEKEINLYKIFPFQTNLGYAPGYIDACRYIQAIINGEADLE